MKNKNDFIKMTSDQIEQNYSDYLKENKMFGFTQSFPVKKVFKSIPIIGECRNFTVRFNVFQCRVTLRGNVNECDAVVTDRVEIAYKLPLNGFNSMCCFDEAETMEKGVVEFCRQHNLMICDKICSWPFAKAIVQPFELITKENMEIKNGEKIKIKIINKEKIRKEIREDMLKRWEKEYSENMEIEREKIKEIREEIREEIRKEINS